MEASSSFFSLWQPGRLSLHSFLHDALPICRVFRTARGPPSRHERRSPSRETSLRFHAPAARSSAEECPEWRPEEHTSELQSHSDLVCRLLLEKKKIRHHTRTTDEATYPQAT